MKSVKSVQSVVDRNQCQKERILVYNQKDQFFECEGPSETNKLEPQSLLKTSSSKALPHHNPSVLEETPKPRPECLCPSEAQHHTQRESHFCGRAQTRPRYSRHTQIFGELAQIQVCQVLGTRECGVGREDPHAYSCPCTSLAQPQMSTRSLVKSDKEHSCTCTNRKI